MLERHTQRQILLEDTASAGAIEARVGAQGIETMRYRERARRYWFHTPRRAQP